MSTNTLVLEALRQLDRSLEFDGWENGDGEEIGEQLRGAVAALEAVQVAWHSPGLGEVHSADHTSVIYCTLNDIESGEERANNELATYVCNALNVTPQEAAPAWIEAADRLPDIDVPVLVMLPDNPHIWPMMREDGGDGWLWSAHTGLALDDPNNYEADDDYLVLRWMPLPAAPKAAS